MIPALAVISPVYLGLAANALFLAVGLYIAYLVVTFLRLGIRALRKYLHEG